MQLIEHKPILLDIGRITGKHQYKTKLANGLAERR